MTVVDILLKIFGILALLAMVLGLLVLVGSRRKPKKEKKEEDTPPGISIYLKEYSWIGSVVVGSAVIWLALSTLFPGFWGSLTQGQSQLTLLVAAVIGIALMKGFDWKWQNQFTWAIVAIIAWYMLFAEKDPVMAALPKTPSECKNEDGVGTQPIYAQLGVWHRIDVSGYPKHCYGQTPFLRTSAENERGCVRVRVNDDPAWVEEYGHLPSGIESLDLKRYGVPIRSLAFEAHPDCGMPPGGIWYLAFVSTPKRY